MKSTSFQWCPECDQFTTHYGVRCAGCDISEEEMDRIVEMESSEDQPSETAQEAKEEVTLPEEPPEIEKEDADPMEDGWVLCKEKKAEFAGESVTYYEEMMEASSKEECEEELDGDASILKYGEGLFFCKGLDETYFIGRPDGFERAGISLN